MKSVSKFATIGIGVVLATLLGAVLWLALKRGSASDIAFLSTIASTAALSIISIILAAKSESGRQPGAPVKPPAQPGEDQGKDVAAVLDRIEKTVKTIEDDSRDFRKESDERFDDLQRKLDDCFAFLQNLRLQEVGRIRENPTAGGIDRTVPKEALKEAKDGAMDIFWEWWGTYDRSINRLLSGNTEGAALLASIDRKLRDAGVVFESAGKFAGSDIIRITLANEGFSGYLILLPIFFFPVPYKYSRYFEGEKDRPCDIARPALLHSHGDEENARLVIRGELR
jgi:hypothetical protein